METKKSLSYLRAKKKVETLKGFYGHAAVYFLINTMVVLISANVFGKGEIDFSNLGVYWVAFMWGIGLVCHALFVFFELYIQGNFLRKWEERKIKEFLEEEP